MSLKKENLKPGIICIASDSSTPEAQASEEQACREWCESENIDVVGVWREKLVDGEPSKDYWMRYHLLGGSLKKDGEKIFSKVGNRLTGPEFDPKAMMRVTWRGSLPGLEYGIQGEPEAKN